MPPIVVVLGSPHSLIRAALRRTEFPDINDIFFPTDLLSMAAKVTPTNDAFFCFDCYNVTLTSQNPDCAAILVQHLMEKANDPSMIFVDGHSESLKKIDFPSVRLVAALYEVCPSDFDSLRGNAATRENANKVYDVFNTFFSMLAYSYRAVTN